MSVLLAARRSAVVPRGGAFAGLEPHALAAPVIAAVLEAAGIAPRETGQLILSNALGAGGNPARMAALAAGMGHVAGLSLDAQCAGGLEAVALGAALVDAGQARVVVAGGAESYSRRPLRARQTPEGVPQFYARPPFSPDPAADPDMTAAAAALADAHGISRAAQDAYAVASHASALAARDRLRAEIVPVLGVADDPFARALSPRLAARSPALAGSVSLAATACEADAAAFCVIVADDLAPPGAGLRLLGHAATGGDSRQPGIAPVAAIRQLLGEGPAPEVIELMEAYAVQAILCQRLAGLPPERINPGGGALARGHPIGASGAVLLCRAMAELERRPGRALCAIAAAGGIGSALLLGPRQG
ncbi:thiolase family protein [Poseidonocella sp. HB161398]|uniref:thiolase family protein n=1 Tax=Poseidonocella sp. HB161398 TaxID=2320855 RepID=UPI0011082D1F|nr:thiolase family protein [Poseidonocella sp. HB161398]